MMLSRASARSGPQFCHDFHREELGGLLTCSCMILTVTLEAIVDAVPVAPAESPEPGASSYQLVAGLSQSAACVLATSLAAEGRPDPASTCSVQPGNR
jgi:hypothetical protein